MKTESLIPTGTANALKIAYDAVTQILGKTPTMLMQEYNGVNYPTLRRIKDGLPVKPTTHMFYMNLFLRLLLYEYHQRIQKGDTGREILRLMAEIGLQEYNMTLDEQP